MAQQGQPSYPGYHGPEGAVPGWGRPARRKTMFVAYALWLVASMSGAHRFYLGRTSSAVLQLALNLGSFLVMYAGAKNNATPVVVVGLLGLGIAVIWSLLDIVLIPFMVRRANM